VTTNKTPSAEWREAGQDDPHGDRYSCEREALALGHLSDDQLANAVFAHNHRELDLAAVMSGESSSITLLTAAKQRIRWLSRRLVATEQEVEQLHRQIDALKMQLADKQYAFYQRGKTLDSVRQKRDQLKAQVNSMKQALTELVDHSFGVAGLHLNGEVAEWSDLVGEGIFCEWLAAFDAAPSQCLATHDAEVIKQFVRDYTDWQGIDWMLTDFMHKRVDELSHQANKEESPNEDCELECGAHGTLCRCNAEQAEEGYQ
jgi:cell division protein FtsB